MSFFDNLNFLFPKGKADTARSVAGGAAVDFASIERGHSPELIMLSGSFSQPKIKADGSGPERPNQDRVMASPRSGTYAVFDGVSGENKNGDRAAELASSILAKDALALSSEASETDLVREIHSLIFRAHQEILSQNQVSSRAVRPGLGAKDKKMSTTASLLHFFRDEKKNPRAMIAQMGDSRVYRWRGGKLEQLTTDDNYAVLDGLQGTYGRVILKEEMVSILGRLDNFSGDLAELSPEGQKIFKDRGRAFGGLGHNREFNPHIFAIDVQPGDSWLLTTDGVHDNLTTDEIATVLAANLLPEETARALTVLAQRVSQRAGYVRAKRDDMSAVVVKSEAPE